MRMLSAVLFLMSFECTGASLIGRDLLECSINNRHYRLMCKLPSDSLLGKNSSYETSIKVDYEFPCAANRANRLKVYIMDSRGRRSSDFELKDSASLSFLGYPPFKLVDDDPTRTRNRRQNPGCKLVLKNVVQKP